MTKTNAFLTTIGEMIVTAAVEDPDLTFENIREMHTTVKGAETLRLMVRDDLGGAADVIATALFDNL